MLRGCNVPEVYGDPALLFPYIYTPKQLELKKADLCLVPHMGDLANDFPWWDDELNSNSSLSQRFTYRDHTTNNKLVRVIDIRTPDAAEFIDLMMTCKIVASASLHGIILAEAYNLTWSWIRLRDKAEQQFKYHDFFLSVGIDKNSTRVSSELISSLHFKRTSYPKLTCTFCTLAIEGQGNRFSRQNHRTHNDTKDSWAQLV